MFFPLVFSLLITPSNPTLAMKLSNLALLTQLSGCYAAYSVKNAAVINILKTGISNGVVDARNTDIPEDQARSEIGSFVPLLMNDILMPVFDDLVDHVLTTGFDVDSFPAFISEVEDALEEYEQSPAFSSATSLLSLVRTHYDYHQAVQLASASMEPYYGILKGAILPLTDEPGPSQAIVEGLFAVTRLICQLQLTDGSVCDPYASEQVTSAEATPVSSAEAAPTSEAASPESSGAAPASSKAAVPESSEAVAPASSEAAAPASSEAAPVSSAAAAPAPFSNSTVPYVTSTVTQTATECSNGDCITATITVTTCVPENAKQTVIETVCPVCEGRTVTITVPCDEEETPAPAPKPAPKPAPAPAPKPDTKPAPKPEEKPAPKTEPKTTPKAEPKAEPTPAPKPAPKPEEKPAPKPAQASNPPPAQANGGNTWAVSTAAGIAAIAALLV